MAQQQQSRIIKPATMGKINKAGMNMPSMENQKMPNTHRSTGKSMKNAGKMSNKSTSLNQKNSKSRSGYTQKSQKSTKRAVNSPSFKKVQSSVRKTMGY